MTVTVTKTVAVLAAVGAAAGENGNGGSPHVVPTRGIAVVLATGIYGLDDVLCIRTVIWLDECGWSGCQNGRRECEGVEIGTFRYIYDEDGCAQVWCVYDAVPTEASWKTINRLVSSLHLILNPPATFSHSEKAAWMSFVLSSLAKPVKDRIRVTEAERPEVEADMFLTKMQRMAQRKSRRKRGSVE